jgi:dTMP kinase
MTGTLIVFEGTDSSGKATQTRFLIEKLKIRNIAVETVDFPQYKNWSAIFVEKYLNGEFGLAGEVTPQQASLFYALDRYAAMPKIKKWLSEGKIIIANRYVSANQAYQGGKIQDEEKRKKFLEWLEHLEHTILGLPKPTLVLYLRVPLEVSKKLLEQRRQRDYIKDGNKDIHEKNHGLLEATERVYAQLVQHHDNWSVIECTEKGKLLSKEAIHKKIWNKVKEKL